MWLTGDIAKTRVKVSLKGRLGTEGVGELYQGDGVAEMYRRNSLE